MKKYNIGTIQLQLFAIHNFLKLLLHPPICPKYFGQDQRHFEEKNQHFFIILVFVQIYFGPKYVRIVHRSEEV